MLTIGILGAAGIAPRSILAPARRRNDVRIEAVASARPGAAASYAAQHGIARAFESYDALIDDPLIDVIYNALPPAAHARWSITALQRGKHVICEKPIAVSAAEARQMVAAAEGAGLFLMEAFHDRYHPLTRHVLELHEDGKLGALVGATAAFRVDIPFDPASIRHVPEQGGGAMMDLGCYPVHWLRALFGIEPTVISAKGEANPLGVDLRMTADLNFGGVATSLSVDMAGGPFFAELALEGERGTIIVHNPVLPHLGHFVKSDLDGQHRQYTIAGDTSFDHQLAAFVDAINTGSVLPTGGADAIHNMTVVDTILQTSGFPRRIAS